jgi:hypothetical protein
MRFCRRTKSAGARTTSWTRSTTAADVAKHARRREAKQKLAGKAPAFGSKRSSAAGSKRNPFQSKARSKASDE